MLINLLIYLLVDAFICIFSHEYLQLLEDSEILYYYSEFFTDLFLTVHCGQILTFINFLYMGLSVYSCVYFAIYLLILLCLCHLVDVRRS